MGPGLVPLALAAGLLLEVVLVVALAFWSRRRFIEKAQPGWYGFVVLGLWLAAVVSPFVDAGDRRRSPPPPELAAGFGLALGAAVAIAWLGVVRAQVHGNRTFLAPLGSGVRAESGPSCAAHGNRVEGLCDRCGDALCPACTYAAVAGAGRFCRSCAGRFREGELL